MSKYVHVVKLAGQLINDDFIESIVKHHRHYIGVAVAKDDKIILHHEQQAPTVDAVKKVMEFAKDNVAVFAFGDVGHILPEDIQPISLLKDADGNDVCVVCLDGDFDRHRKSNEAHIPEYTVAKDNLAKRIAKYASKSSSIDGVIEELNDDVTRADICNLWGNRGSITFLFSDGQVCTIQAGNDKAGNYDWGYASYSYQTQAEEPKKSVIDKGVDTLKSLMGSSTVAKAPPQNGVVVANGLTTNGTDTKVNDLPEGTVLIKPDFSHKTLQSRKEKERWYENRLGYAVRNAKEGPLLLRIPGKDGSHTWRLADTKSLSILKHTVILDPPKASPLAQDKPPVEPQVQPEVTPEVTPEPVKEVPQADLPPWMQGKKVFKSTVREAAPKEVGGQQSKTAQVALPAGGNQQAQDKVPASVRTDRVPMLSPDQKQKMQEIMKRSEFVGTFGEGLKQVNDPKALKAQLEQEIPDMAKALGIGNDMSVFAGWKFEQFYLLANSIISVGKNNPEAASQMAAKMMFDLSCHALKTKVSLLTNPNYKPNKVA